MLNTTHEELSGGSKSQGTLLVVNAIDQDARAVALLVVRREQSYLPEKVQCFNG